MKKLTVMIMIAMLSVVGCSNQTQKIETTKVIEIEENVAKGGVEDVSTEVEDTAIVKKLKEKFLAETAVELESEDRHKLNIDVPNGYEIEILNKVDIETNVELIAKLKSDITDNKQYIIEIYDVPLESKDFLFENTLKIGKTTNESANKLVDIMNVNNTEIETDLTALDSTGNELKVTKYEVKTDLTILDIDNIGLYREPPTYFVIETEENYFALLFNESLVENSDNIVEMNEESVEAIEYAQVELKDTIIENEDEIEDDTEHREQIKDIYNGLDDATKKYIETFKEKFVKKDIQTQIDNNKISCEKIDKLAFSMLNNIMVGSLNTDENIENK